MVGMDYAYYACVKSNRKETKKLQVWVSEEEQRDLAVAAARAGQTVPAFVRSTLFPQQKTTTEK